MFHIELVCGHRCRRGNPLAVDRIAAAETVILDAFAALFRGGRLRQERGSYRTSDKRTILEQCTVISCETMALEPGTELLLQELAGTLAKDLEQETVLLTITRIDGVQHWVPPGATEW